MLSPAAELSPELHKAVLESLPTGVYVVDRNRRIQFWNEGAERITGYLRQEVIGRLCPDNLLMHCVGDNVVLCGANCPLKETVLDGHPRTMDLFLRHKEGQRVPVRVRCVPLRNAHGVIIGAVECFDERDVFPTVTFDAQKPGVNHAVHYLGELPSFQKVLAGLNEAIEEFAGSNIPFGVLAIRLDSLDELQQFKGRHAVNTVLGMVARTLSRNLGPADLLGRWSDHCFVVVIKSCTPANLVRFAEMLKRLVSLAGVPWWGDQLTATISVGGTIIHHDDTAETVIHRAEQLLQSGIAEGGDRVVVAA